MKVLIRQIQQRDFPDLTDLFNDPAVVRNMTQLPYGTEQQWQQRLRSDDQCITLVADYVGSAIGCITLMSERGMRRKHVASLAMAVTPAFHHQGVGTQLLNAAIALSNDWMNIARIELGVYTSNRHAIKLYHQFDFLIEGEANAYSFGEGEYQNLLYMARVQKNRGGEKARTPHAEQVDARLQKTTISA